VTEAPTAGPGSGQSSRKRKRKRKRKRPWDVTVRPVRGVAIPEEPVRTWPHLQRVGARRTLREYLRDLWAWRDFVWALPTNELRSQNQDTVFGQLWHLLNPLMLAAVYYVVFGRILGIARGGFQDPLEYVRFLVVGVLAFNLFRTTVRSGARIITKNRNLVQSISFPRVILPLSAVIEEGLSHIATLTAMWVVLLITGVVPTAHWLMVVPILFVQLLFNLGLTMIVGRVTFHFRDVSQMVPYVLRIWFYISGVIVPMEGRFVGNDTALFILQLNPAYAFVEMSRDAFIHGQFVPSRWAVAGAWTLVLLVFGFWFFRRAESEYGRE
jgi:teichoic acid transport system permease protein